MDDDSPPRRRRSSPPPPERSFPLTPILIGVIVLGFVIGAGLSMAGKHGGNQVAVVSSPEPEPTETLEAQPSPHPHPSHHVTIVASAAPKHTATPAASASPEATASPQASVTPEATASAVASETPVSSAVPSHVATPSHAATHAPTAVPATPVASARVVASATHRATPEPVATHRPTPAPTDTPTEAPTVAPTLKPTPTPLPTDDADSSFGRLSASVVRQYLRALARGDTASAYGAFGQGPGGGADLSEKAFVDPSLQITGVQARGSGDAQSVNVTFTTASGSYAGQYTLHRTQTGAAVIVSHNVNKL